MSEYLLFYLVFGFPFFLFYFVQHSRKHNDVTLGDFAIMVVVSFLPVFREVVAIAFVLLDLSYTYGITTDTVLFKEKE